MNEVMNLAQLASYLKMSQAQVYHLVAAGRIPGTKVGKQWRFFGDTIDRWLQGESGSHPSVLVVEDDRLIRNLVTRTLSDAGHRVASADSAKSAATLLDELEFDIIFLDLLLPDGSGLDVVNAAARLSSVPEIVLVTGHPDHALVDEIRSILPYVIVMSKPVRLQVLLELAGRFSGNGGHELSRRAHTANRAD